MKSYLQGLSTKTIFFLISRPKKFFSKYEEKLERQRFATDVPSCNA